MHQMPQQWHYVRLWVRLNHTQLAHDAVNRAQADSNNSDKFRANGKVYPKGYVQLLERQQGILLEAVHKMYRDRTSYSAVGTDDLLDASHIPCLHSILADLGLTAPPSTPLTWIDTPSDNPHPSQACHSSGDPAPASPFSTPKHVSMFDHFESCPANTWLLCENAANRGNDELDCDLSIPIDQEPIPKPQANAFLPPDPPQLTPQNFTSSLHDPFRASPSRVLDDALGAFDAWVGSHLGVSDTAGITVPADMTS